MNVQIKITLSEQGIIDLSKRLGEPEWMLDKRLAAFRAYKSMEMPKWDRTDPVGLDLEELVIYEPGEDPPGDLPDALSSVAEGIGDQAHLLCQIDSKAAVSRLQKELEDEGAIVCDFMTAVREHEEIVRKYYMSAVGFDEDKLTALHYAAVSGGYFVYVPKDTAVKLPIELRTYSERPGLALFPHVLVVAERGAEVTVVEGVQSEDGDVQRVVSEIVEICPMDGAQIRYGAVQNWGDKTYNFTIRRAVHARDARVEWLSGDFGAALSRSHSKSLLRDQGSEATNLSVFFGTDSQHMDIGITMFHEGDHTASDMLTKGVLSDRARCVYRGLTDIENGARFTSGFQRENTMLLSEEARSDAIPGLEIDETEVQAGHAATVGQIDKVQLFYLMSRGLPKREAMHLIVQGFFDPILQRIPLDGVREELSELIGRKMNG